MGFGIQVFKLGSSDDFGILIGHFLEGKCGCRVAGFIYLKHSAPCVGRLTGFRMLRSGGAWNQQSEANLTDVLGYLANCKYVKLSGNWVPKLHAGFSCL